MSEFGIITIGEIQYIGLSLDANESGASDSEANKITLSEMQIFIDGDSGMADPENNGGYSGAQFDNTTPNMLIGHVTPDWMLDDMSGEDGANGDVDILLQASICETNGQCGSGKGDLSVLIPLLLLGEFNPTDYFVLYTEYHDANSGFEEWSFYSDVSVVPLPAALPLYGTGLAIMGFIGWRKRRKATTT